ncbi:membrane or secreted protein [Ekhidna sp.]|uniref:membrane or secreted protein n=1 Tax=Ekhidna sp. TaxID=2608089 RepID=UPI003BA8A6C2
MKKTLLLSLLFLVSQICFSQSLVGAWEWLETDEEGKKIKGVVTFSESYQAAAWFDAETGAFVKTNGGTWKLDGNNMTEVAEFNTAEPDKVGETASFEIEWDGSDKMRRVGMDAWATRVDDGTPGDLNGAWLMSGRKRNGEVQQRDTDRPRKTMKILSGTRFHWIAYNTETKQFMGTGGGTYTTIDGKYTENIEFFSRDDSRVGASLEFNYELKDGKWHHSGKSSKGEPLYEVWSMRD